MGKLVWVKATARGQLPDKVWKDETSAPFQVDEGKVSKRWMKEIDAAEAKAEIKKTQTGDVSGVDDVSDERIDELTKATEAAEKERDAAQAKVKELEQENAQLKADLESATKPKGGQNPVGGSDNKGGASS